MAPARVSPKQELEDPNDTGRAEFEASLASFGRQRGILIEFNTRVAGQEIDLYRLWKVVNARGGYDAVSAEKLAWRRLGYEFGLGQANAAAYAFALKTTYYKNLAAFELKSIHGKEPPPVDILENLTAKGGNILNRTVENFQPILKNSSLANGEDSESDDTKTPKDDKMDVDDPGSGAGRTTRGLRQQPPQRILFQPDVSSSRQTRHSTGTSPQPMFSSPGSAAAAHPTSSASIANYEPRSQVPLTLRPVVTPQSNFQLFHSQVKKDRDEKLAAMGLGPTPTLMKPGAGFDGPNIYVRILNSLRCPLPAEQDYALHHMVKISHERGDKYRFDSFPGLADGLLDRLLTVSSLFYDVEWRISYTQDPDDMDDETLDGIDGTRDILNRLSRLKRIDDSDDLQSGEFVHKMNKQLEAALTLRNLALLEENALYLADMAQLRDFLSIALNLPSTPATVEMKHYALDVAEQVVRYWQMDQDDPLYQSLLRVIDDGSDRGAMVTALKTLCRISLYLEDTFPLPGIPASTLQRVFEWIVLGDEEFTSVCLDFLYQFTALPRNVLFMFTNCNELALTPFTTQLARLLQYRAAPIATKIVISKEIPLQPATVVPGVPRDLIDQFLRHEEPERSKLWLRSVFEEDAQSFITQIELWQAYQERFKDHAASNPLLQAADFIKNVSHVFQGANAQVITEPTQRFIIKGIRPRHAPVDYKGRSYSKCQWKHDNVEPCKEYQLKPRHMLDHIARGHLKLTRNPEGGWDNVTSSDSLPKDCYWAGCRHFERRTDFVPTAKQLIMHAKTHLPDTTSTSAYRRQHNRTPATQVVPVKMIDGDVRPADVPNVDPEHGREATHKQVLYQNTAADEIGNAAGIPLAAALVLRNLARNVPKAIAMMEGGGDHDQMRLQAMQGMFGGLKERLMWIIAHNRPLAGFAADIQVLVEKGMVTN